MTSFLRTALPLIAALSATGIASKATALNVTNCTGIGIRVHVYNNNDTVQMFARAGGYIEAGHTSRFNVGRGLMAVKIFQSGLIDQMRLSESAITGNGNYRVSINTRGRWSIVRGSGC